MDAQNLAKKRLEKTEYDKSRFNFLWNSEIRDSKYNDLVILATLSKNRLEQIKTLVKSNKRFLLEKMVCQSEIEYDSIISLINSTSSKAWINASRRYFNSYQNLKKQFLENFDTDIVINGGNMGLGSNAIHFLDLFSWFTNKTTFELDGKFLDNEILDNKRGNDYKEFSGTIMGKSANNSKFFLNFSRNYNLPLCVGFFGKKTFIVNETKGECLDLSDDSKSQFKIELQSDLTAKVAHDILKTDNSLLPTLEDSKLAHCELFRIFNEHVRKITKQEVDKCPIT